MLKISKEKEIYQKNCRSFILFPKCLCKFKFLPPLFDMEKDSESI